MMSDCLCSFSETNRLNVPAQANINSSWEQINKPKPTHDYPSKKLIFRTDADTLIQLAPDKYSFSVVLGKIECLLRTRIAHQRFGVFEFCQVQNSIIEISNAAAEMYGE